MSSKTLLTLALCIFAQAMIAQTFSKPALRFSDDKISYITLKDGTEIQGYLRDLDRKKGLIEQVKFKDVDGNKYKWKPEEISHMYLPPSGWSKFANAVDFKNDAKQWTKEGVDAQKVSNGYAYYEHSDVMIKKKKKSLLLQLINPTFCNVIKVYNDPFAKETASFGVAGVKMAGGDEKSYYIKKDKVAYKLKKKNYKTEFAPLFESCSAVTDKYSKIKWTEFADHVFEASENCK